MCGIAYNALALFTITALICLYYYVLIQFVNMMNHLIGKPPTKDNNWG
ncbi:hypothetical protein EW026_g3171 [Hermanssonia centrifuga]|uniref:Uncharacterized protein n=1 Tax=Hermanssonia centrifuga TaxID=98765 RepID=A0A4S4KKZ5_9APHY|nr:hypothetical protein EW026_g3171 [Hermanssonia centrifuga]